MKQQLLQLEPGVPGVPALVLVRGYLNRGIGKQRERWLSAVRASGFRGCVFEFGWDASTPRRFASNVVAFRDWRAAKERAKSVGREVLPGLLNELTHSGVTLIGASAGARVVYHALLSEHLLPGKVKDAWFLGGAMRRNGHKDWEAAASAVAGKLINVYSRKDVVLATLYRAASRGALACGTGPIESSHPGVVNVDATEWVGGGPLYLATHGHYSRALARRDMLAG